METWGKAIYLWTLQFILTLWFVIELKTGWSGRPYAWFIVSCIYFIISGIYLIKRGYIRWIKPSYAIIKETLWYALPLIPHSISYWIKQGADRYILNYYYNTETVGYFSFAMNLASIMVMIGTAFNSSNSVYIYKNLKQGYDNIKNTIRYIFPQYISSIIYIIPLMTGAVFQCIYLLFVNYIFYYKKTSILMYISLTTAIVQIILSIVLTKYSTIYTAYISMSMSIFTAICVCLYSKKLIKYKFKDANET